MDEPRSHQDVQHTIDMLGFRPEDGLLKSRL
jgi:hypothetical protein